MRLILITIIILCAQFLKAQVVNFNNLSTDKLNHIQFSAGLNMAVMANVEYARILYLKSKPILLSANFTLPMGQNIGDDKKFSINASGNIMEFRNWGFPIHLGIHSVHTGNKMIKITGLGTKVSINPGYYKNTWFAGVDIGYEKQLLTHIKNSDFYKEVYFSEANDGWYSGAGGNLFFGFIAGKSINHNELNLKAGYIATEKFQTLLVPYYAEIAFKINF
jgi:hypothetical protein